MKTHFITTEDKDSNLYKINISQIILIEDFADDKYYRRITLTEKNQDGSNRKVESVNSLKELEEMISIAQL